MGLIQVAKDVLGGTLASQWKEYFYCEAMPNTVLAAKGQKKVSGRFGGSKTEDENIITNGSIIAVNDGQAMIVVDNGKVVEFSAEPGAFQFNNNGEPTIFEGDFKGVLKTAWDRVQYGGQVGRDLRVYYFNLKELIGNKYGTPSPVPFRVVDNNIGLDVDISVKCFGEYSYHIVDPVSFYTNVCGNISGEYSRDNLDSQLKTELLTALQPAFAKISEMGIRYSALPAHTLELSEALNEVLSEKWTGLRGIEIVSFGVSSIKANEEDEAMIKELQKNAVFRNPNMAAAHLVGAQAQAMQDAANNQGGAYMGFVGMNAAQNAGGMNAQALFQMGQQQAAPQQNGWKCPACGAQATGKFCPECGAQKPEAQGSWKCPACGAQATGKFCPECGAKKPEAQTGWKCPACGAQATGKFCPECGAKKPVEKKFRCDKCGWVPSDPSNPPKFCPECGDIFDENDAE